jgi:hypothetical protein
VLATVGAMLTVLVAVSGASAGRSGWAVAGIKITADGVSPRPLLIKAANSIPVWSNLDAVAHTVMFDDGRCVVELAPGERDGCEGRGSDFFLYAGTYRYRVSELIEPTGEIVVVPNERRVTMVASRTTVRAGQRVTLGGSVFAKPIPPFGVTPTPTVTLLRRASGSQRFVAIRQVRSRDCPRPYPNCELNEAIWSVTIRSRATAAYVARIVDPPAQTVWERAESQRIVIRVTPSPTR